MSSIDTEPETVTSEPPKAAPERDVVLQAIAETLQESGDGEFQLTVTVGGLLISGVAIGRDQWFRDTAQFMEDAGGSGEIPKAFLAAFEDADQGSPDRPVVYAYLHMKDARTFSADGVVPANSGVGMYWRGRISEITGFSFGQLKVS